MGSLAEAAAGRGVRRDPARRPDPAQPARAERITTDELWTLPGGGLDHGEDPRDARGPRGPRGDRARRRGRRDRPRLLRPPAAASGATGARVDAHALRIVYDGWVPLDAPEPRVVEVDGSTVEAAWQPVADVLDGTVPVGAAGARGAGRPPAVPACSGSRRTPWSSAATARCCSPGSPRAATTPAPGRSPAAASTTASRRARRWSARCTRSAGSTCEVGDLLDVARRALRRHRAVGPLRGLPRRAPGLRRHRARGRRAAGRRGRRHHRRRRLGAAGRHRGRETLPVGTSSGPSHADRPLDRGRRRSGSPAPIWRSTEPQPGEELTMSETVFTYAAPALKFGPGASAEVGHDLRGVRRPPGPAGHRPRRRRHRPPRPDRRADGRPRPRGRRRTTASRVEPTDESMARGDRLRPRRRARSTRSWRSAAAPRSTPPRRSTCSSPTRAS